VRARAVPAARAHLIGRRRKVVVVAAADCGGIVPQPVACLP
jgi:hypothetical protein